MYRFIKFSMSYSSDREERQRDKACLYYNTSNFNLIDFTIISCEITAQITKCIILGKDMLGLSYFYLFILI